MELKKYKLGEIGEIRMCKRILKSETNPYFGIPFYKIGTFGKIADAFIDPLLYKHYKKSYSFPRKGDVLISAAGTIGKSFIYNGEDAYFQDSNIVWIEHDQSIVLNEFLYYLLNSIQWIPSKGSTIFRLYNDDIRNKEVFIPSIKEQRGIVSVLSSIDRKIELNRTINQNLEAMAKQLYDYWFVQFDFPDENGRPYKSSGGKMVWNEKLKREIPSCFNIANMEKLCKFRNGINYSKDETGNDFQIVNVRNISSSKILLDGEDFDTITVPMTKAENYLLKSEDIIIARSGCPGSTRLLISPTNTLFCGFIICCTPHNSSMRNYLTYCLKQLEGTNATTSGGSILQNVSQDTLKGLPIVVPNKQIIDKFNETIELIFTRILNCLKETKALTKQRDELLPLLMNGQVSVNSDLAL
ncbi:MAG: restriction endonuclease subunit S [Bacteroidales bacterium]|nr:restriction endonuclease subunit S [Bacteroidales bacterium]